MSTKIDINALFAAGAHFGHKTSRWHPKMAPYIYGKRSGAHVIDLTKTVAALEAALPRVTDIVKNGGKILFVGTRKAIQEATKTTAESVNMPYVTERWIGGTLTNTATINKQLRKLSDLERRMASGELENRYSKLEVQRYQEEINALETRYGGIKNLSGRPAALLVADAKDDQGAIREAKSLNIPIFAIVDTNVDPTPIDYVIPANDDSIKSIELILSYFADAVQAGQSTPKADAAAKPAKVDKM